MQDAAVKWEGAIASAFEGKHKFAIKYAGYIKVWIDGQMVLDRWRQSWNPCDALLNLDMQKNKKYAIKIEWNPDGGESFLTCRWLSPMPGESNNKFAFFSEAGEKIDYYFMYGKNMDEVISGYRTITGKAPIMPDWAMGFWQSRERYRTQADILNVAKEFRQRKIPLDNIVMDWQYWKIDQWGSQQFDADRFSNPDSMIDVLHKQYHTKFMVSVWAKFYKGIPNFNLMQQQGFLLNKNADED